MARPSVSSLRFRSFRLAIDSVKGEEEWMHSARDRDGIWLAAVLWVVSGERREEGMRWHGRTVQETETACGWRRSWG